ncbi:hypothetical protein JCM1841_006622 [Sporobolomyces salmonicolor]
MDSTAPAVSGDRMVTRDRRNREGFHYMASDSDSDGISDGDPPGYEAAPQPQPPPPPSASAPHAARGTVGADGQQLLTAPPRRTGKRSFEELEDIIFANPRSFATLAFAIAESRGVTLVVSDDRTHKVSSAYMHVTCAFRKAGCPFILKLTKAKEGGWVLKGAKAQDVDPKQRSIYRCRHPAGSVAEVPPMSPYHPDFGKTTSHPGESGSKPKAAPRPRTSTSSIGASRTTGGPRSPEPVSYEQFDSSAGKAKKPRIGGPTFMAPSTSRMGTPINGGMPVRRPSDGGSGGDRALAPPFERSMNLQSQIAPVLNANGFYAPSSAPRGEPTYLYSGVPSSLHPQPPASASPRQRNPQHQQIYTSFDAPFAPPPVTGDGSQIRFSPPPTAAPPPPVVATSHPSALPDWTALLASLGDQSLVPLAKVLASPHMSVTPTSFFSEPAELRKELLDLVPAEATGVWPKLRLRERLVALEAEEKWRAIEKERKADQEKRDERESEGDGKGRSDTGSSSRGVSANGGGGTKISLTFSSGGAKAEPRTSEEGAAEGQRDVEMAPPRGPAKAQSPRSSRSETSYDDGQQSGDYEEVDAPGEEYDERKTGSHGVSH